MKHPDTQSPAQRRNLKGENPPHRGGFLLRNALEQNKRRDIEGASRNGIWREIKKIAPPDDD